MNDPNHDPNHEIVTCQKCGELEYNGMIHWKSGKTMCRRCIYEVWRNEVWQPKEGRDLVFPLYEDGADYSGQANQAAVEKVLSLSRTITRFASKLQIVEHIGLATQLTTMPLYSSYLKWRTAARKELVSLAESRIIFSREMQQLGFTKAVRPINKVSANVFIGVVIVDPQLLEDYNYYETLRIVKQSSN